LLAFLSIFHGFLISATAQPNQTITTYEELWELPATREAEGLPVQIDGIVTLTDTEWNLCFVQSGNHGNYYPLNELGAAAVLGHGLRMEGNVSIIGGEKIIINKQPKDLGPRPFPEAAKPDLGELAQFPSTSQRMEIEGRVIWVG